MGSLEGMHVRSHRDISAIQDFGPAVEGVGIKGDIVSAAEAHFT